MTDRELELLSQYLDDALAPDDRAALHALLESSPQAREQLRRMQQTDHQLKRAFDACLRTPVPSRFEDLLAAPQATEREAPPSALPRSAANWPRFAIAAAVSGMAVAAWLTLNMPSNETTAIDSAHLQGVLNTAAPHEPLTDANSGERLTVIATYIASDGRPCREFELVRAEGQTSGLACLRPHTGHWEVEATMLSQSGTSGGAYAPAAGGLDVIAEALDRIGAKGPVSPETDAQLRENGWSPIQAPAATRH